MNKYLTKLSEMRERKFPKTKGAPKKPKSNKVIKRLKLTNPAKPKNVIKKEDKLVKKAFFGFGQSDVQKLNNRHQQHFINIHNLYAKHANLELKRINAMDFGDMEKSKAARTKYVDEIVNTMKNHKQLHKEYEDVHSKYESDVKALGGKPIHDMKRHIENIEDDYRLELDA